MADIHITVDGVPITVPEGTNVVDAARTVGISIPVFCYHPRLESVGMCRMCLVEISVPRIDRGTGKPVLDDDGKPVIARMPKLQTACTTKVSDGMQVRTDTEEVKFAQNGVLEFLLTSHPLDCPVCDKGGECPLQNLTMEWGPGQSRFDYTDKMHFEKPIPLSDLIYLDRERCILCGRCVRYQDEIADDSVLGYSSRGRQWHIISKSDPPFDSKFSGNTTDICPVGALTTADFRFKARAWEVTSVPAVCNHCPVGCNMSLDMRHEKIMRVMPRENAAVNDIWICDKGRFAQRYIESSERLATPLIRRGDTLEPASWDEALELVGERMAAIQRSAGGGALAGLASERHTNEDLYAFQKLFREVLGSNNLDHRVGRPGEPEDDNIGAALGVGSGTNLLSLGQGTTVLVLGADPEEEAPLYMLRLRGIAQRGGSVIALNNRPTKLDRSATTHLHYRPGTEVRVGRALLKALLEEPDLNQSPPHVAGLNDLRQALGSISVATEAELAGLREADIRGVARSLLQAENGILLYGADALAAGPALTHDLGSLLLLAGKVGRANNGLIPLLSSGNSRGALDMGVRPDYAPGYRSLEQPGLSAHEMWPAATQKQLRGMYVMGLDPAADAPAARAALEALEFLVVQDMFLSETAKLAHVVLPASSFAERDGTFTNAERRVQRTRQARTPYAECRADWDIVQAVAQQLGTQLEPVAVPAAAQTSAQHDGKGKDGTRRHNGQTPPTPASTTAIEWDYLTSAEVAMEIAERVPGYSGITHTRLASTGMVGTWGRQTNEDVYYDGTNYENTEGVGIQYPATVEQPKASFNVKPLPFDMQLAGQQYPFALLVQPLLYSGDPLLRDSLLLEHVPEPYVAINRADAKRLEIARGAQVRVSSAAGALDLPARLVSDLPEGSVLIPANLPGAPLAQLQTGPRTYVALSKIEG
jgi:NADH-quinone oxidoreductase subunit G